MEKRRTSVAWTEREDALICRLRRKEWDLDEIAAKLPQRTTIAVKRRIAHLINSGRIASLRAPWTPEEDAVIRQLRAQSKPAAAIAEHLESRTPAAVAQRIQELRVAGRMDGSPVTPRASRRWTDREESVLVAMRTRPRPAKLDEIAAKLPRRTRGAVAVRLNELIDADEVKRSVYSPQSHQPWSSEEDALVTLMRRAGKTKKQMAAALGRSHASVKSRIIQLVRKGELGLVRANGSSNAKPQE